MLSKQLTSKLKQEQEKENQANPSHLSVVQCDRLIRTVSCKHDANHAVKKSNINVLQSYEETKLYVSPHYSIQRPISPKTPDTEAGATGAPAATEEKVTDIINSVKLKRKHNVKLVNETPSKNQVDSGEIGIKDLLQQIVDKLTTVNVNQWFAHGTSPESDQNLFEPIQQALNHIDFNLKRNSDFINELTKLLDTSRSIKQEANLKRISKNMDEDKTNKLQSTPASPAPQKKDDRKKSFSLLSLASKSPKPEKKELHPPVNTEADLTASLSQIDSNFRLQMKLQNNQNNEVNNSNYIELENEVEKISYHLESLASQWSKLDFTNTNDLLKSAIEFQALLGNVNSAFILKELEQSLFKINWLVSSKSGFSEPNWQSSVLSLTPSTIDSFIGVNLLKNYYKYVKYDFVSYKLFTRQIQLIQLCAIILSIVHKSLNYYREVCTLSTIASNGGFTNEGMVSFAFSADKYRPISWSANHVTLYNVQNRGSEGQSALKGNESPGVSRSSSQRRTTTQPNEQVKEEQMRKIKCELFLKEMTEFLHLSTNRLNIQASIANRTGYFYIVNQSTGLVLQAVDFASDASLSEQIEKKRQQQSFKGQPSQSATKPPAGANVSKGPRFYLMNKIHQNSGKLNNSDNSVNYETAHDEQLWYYYLINGCVANKTIRSGHCMAASSLNAKSPVCFWPNVKTTNCSWFYNSHDNTIVSGLDDELCLDFIIVDEAPNTKRYAVVIDTKCSNKVSQKWAFEFC